MLRFVFAFAFATAASAGPLCIPGATLASYEALGVAGCVVDPTISLAVGSFSYSVLASSSPGVITPDTSISVTPVVMGSGHFGIDFAATTFALTGSNFVDYQIGFTWDPPPIRSADDLLDPPVVLSPGLARVTTALCLGTGFTGTFCPLPSAMLTVSDNGITPVLTDAVSFAPVTTLGVLNTLELNGGGSSGSSQASVGNGAVAGSARIDGFFNNITTAPEPATLFIAACGLLMLEWRRRLRR